MRAVHVSVVIAVTVLSVASTARSQDSTPVVTMRPIAQDEASTPRLVIGGISGAFAGMGAGAGVGLLAGAAGCRSSGQNSRDMCGLTYGLGGALAGLVIGAPIGVHLANHRRGSAILTVIGSVAATAALLAVGSTLKHGSGPAFVLMLPFEIGMAIPIERDISWSRVP